MLIILILGREENMTEVAGRKEKFRILFWT